MVDIGSNGRNSDGGVLKNSTCGKALSDGTLQPPKPKPLPGRRKNVPFVFVADDTFPLKENMMKPYASRDISIASRIFNYRLSRASRIVENAFGIPANRFRVLGLQ